MIVSLKHNCMRSIHITYAHQQYVKLARTKNLKKSKCTNRYIYIFNAYNAYCDIAVKEHVNKQTMSF